MKYFLITIFSLIQTWGIGQTLISKSNSVFIDELSDINLALDLNKENEWLLLYEEQFKNKIYKRYAQSYQGIPVYGSSIILRNQKLLTSLQERPNIMFDAPSIALETYINAHINEQTRKYFIDILESMRGVKFKNVPQILIKETELNFVDRAFPEYSGVYTLAHKNIVETSVQGKIFKRTIFTDVESQRLIGSASLIHDGNAIGTGASFYYDEVSIITDSIAENQFVLRDLSRGDGIIIKDRVIGLQEFHIDDDNHWDFTEVYEQSLIDALYCTEKYYDLLWQRFGRSSIDGLGKELICQVNDGTYTNAFWDGAQTNYGLGDCTDYGPLVSLDIVGHEFTHGLTNYTSNLIYAGEPGAINESMSDIFGKALEHYYDPSSFSWDIGRKILISNDAEPFRQIADPWVDWNPKFYRGTFWKNTDSWIDNGGVHQNSGVINYMCYLLVEGESGLNEIDCPYDVAAIGWDDTIDLFYLLQSGYLSASSNFTDFYLASLMAAKDLFGENTPGYQSVVEALKAVGLDNTLVEGFYALDISNFNSSLFATRCLEDFQNLNYKIINLQKTIVSGTQLSVRLEHYNPKEQIITLAQDLVKGDTLVVNFDLDWTQEDLDTRHLYCQVHVESLDSLLSIYNWEQFNYNSKGEGYSIRSFPIYLNSLACSDEFIDRIFPNVLLNDSCGIMEIGQSVNYQIANDFDSYNGTTTITNSPLSSPFDRAFDLLIPSNIQQDQATSYYLDAALLDSSGQIVASWKDTFDFYSKKELNLDDVISFETDHFKHLITFRTYRYDVTNSLLLEGTQYTSDAISECAPLDFYFSSIRPNDLETFEICINSDSLSNASLEFDVRFLYDNSFLSAAELPYSLFLNVDIQGLVSEPILTPNNIWEHKSIDLPPNFAGSASFQFRAIWSDIEIDNIRLVDKSMVITQEELQPEDFSIFPNPAQNNVAFTGLEIGDVIDLMDMQGRRIAKHLVKSEHDIIDLLDLTSGIYLISLKRNGTRKACKKMIKQ